MKIITLIIALFAVADSMAQRDMHSFTKDTLKGQANIIIETRFDAVEKFGEIQKEKLGCRFIQKYDSIGNKTEQNFIYFPKILKDERSGKILYTSDERSGKIIYSYDDNKNITEENEYNSEGNLENRSILKYDVKGNLKELNKFNPEGNLSTKRIYKYNDKGNMIEANLYFSDGILYTKSIFGYNNKGIMTEKNEYNSEGVLRDNSKYEYDKYDNIGNWIKLILFFNDKPLTIIERQIEYY